MGQANAVGPTLIEDSFFLVRMTCDLCAMRVIQDYNNSIEVRNCRLDGLRDLKGDSRWVRERIVDYLNQLIDCGVAGFRIDAAKHMWPRDLYDMLNTLHRLSTSWFPANTSPFVYQEVRITVPHL